MGPRRSRQVMAEANDSTSLDLLVSSTQGDHLRGQIEPELRLRNIIGPNSRSIGHQHHELPDSMIGAVPRSRPQYIDTQPIKWLTYSLPITYDPDLHPEFELRRCGDGWVPESKTIYLPPLPQTEDITTANRSVSVLCISDMAQLDRPFCDELRKLRAMPPHIRSKSVVSNTIENQCPSLTSEPSVEDDYEKDKIINDDMHLTELVDQLFALWPKGVPYYYALSIKTCSGDKAAVPKPSAVPQQEAQSSKTNAKKDLKAPQQSGSGNNARVKGKRQMMAADEVATVWRCVHEACVGTYHESCDGNLTLFASMIRHAKEAKSHEGVLYHGRSFTEYLDKFSKLHNKGDDECCEILSALLFRSMNPTQIIPYLRFQRLPNGNRKPLPLLDSTLEYIRVWSQLPTVEQAGIGSFSDFPDIAHNTGETFTAYNLQEQNNEPAIQRPPNIHFSSISHGNRVPATSRGDDSSRIFTSPLPSTQNGLENLSSLDNWERINESFDYDLHGLDNHDPQAVSNILPQEYNNATTTTPSGSWKIVPELYENTTSGFTPSTSSSAQYATARIIVLSRLKQDPSSRLFIENVMATTKSARENEEHEKKRIKLDYDDSMEELNREATEKRLDYSSKKRKRQEIEDQRTRDLEVAEKSRVRILDDAVNKIEQRLLPSITAQLELSSHPTPSIYLAELNTGDIEFPDACNIPQFHNSAGQDNA